MNDSEDISTPLWKISSGKNGDKYLTFSGSPGPTTNRTQRALSNIYEIDDTDSLSNSSNPHIRVYKVRWYILSVICMSNITNAINWICYSSIADFTGEFYSIDYNSVNYLSLVYLIISVPAGFFLFG